MSEGSRLSSTNLSTGLGSASPICSGEASRSGTVHIASRNPYSESVLGYHAWWVEIGRFWCGDRYYIGGAGAFFMEGGCTGRRSDRGAWR